MPHLIEKLLPFVFVIAWLGAPPGLESSEFIWQIPQAEELPGGGLQWAPQPHRFQTGATVRYIDYAAGDDANPGTKAAPWKHHPWDAKAGAQAAQGVAGPVTYVFKGGVIYRGTLSGRPRGSAEEPVRLTRDPSWGEGPAALYGSHQITGGWTKGGDGLPDKLAGKQDVWFIDLPTGVEPRNFWMVRGEEVSPLPLARIPNWHIEGDDHDDPKESWFTARKTATHVQHDGAYRYQIDLSDELPRDPDFFAGAYIRYEWGPVMGTPTPAKIYDYDPDAHTMLVHSFFPVLLKQGQGYLGRRQIFGGSAYSFENNPRYLDEPGEWWFAESGPNAGRLYLLPPEGMDPNRATFEAGKHLNLIATSDAGHLEIAGLTFRFTNMPPRLTSVWAANPAAVLHAGQAGHIVVRNNTFAHINAAVDIDPAGDGIERVDITDNRIHHADHLAIDVGGSKTPDGPRVGEVRILRNDIASIGFHPMRVSNGHAVTAHFPDVVTMAGNILHRTGGWGLASWGGKGDGEGGDAPFTRHLIFQNSVTDPLLFSNDWGGIETWQGGPFYVFNNHVHNPIGIMGFGNRRFGHAYYMDGSFKNFAFNNIASGENSDPDSIDGNTAAFQEIHSYQNTVFHNTVFRFLTGSRRQAAEPGRNKYLGNVFQDIGERVFRHSDSKNTDPNAFDAGERGPHMAYETNAYGRNVFSDVDQVGNFHALAGDHETTEDFGEALTKVHSMASDVGVLAGGSILRDPAHGDFRLRTGTVAENAGAKVFVPWSLSATVGEWHFTRNQADPAVVFDESWYLTDYHIGRRDYEERPSHPLQAQHVDANDYIMGELENWTEGALNLDGERQYLRLSQKTLEQPFEYQGKVTSTVGGWAEVTLPQAMKAGRKAMVTVTLKDPPKGQKLSFDLNWLSGSGFGGFNAWGGKPQDVTGNGPYTFAFTPTDKPGLHAFQINLYLSPDGTFANASRSTSQEVPVGDSQETHTLALGGQKKGAKQAITVTGKDLKNPQIHHSSFILELFLKVDAGSEGILVEKMNEAAGYSLRVDAQGRPVFAVQLKDGRRAELTASAPITNGTWHHLLAESDRDAGTLSLFIDGEAAGSTAGPSDGDGTIANQSDLFVGGSPDGGHVPMTIDFLRISLGSLADARTTIEELHAWQFAGPFLKDRTGRSPAPGQRRDAGALQSR